ncbi:ankyrin repeat domain-containing protein [Brachyspira hampsonii]|uniref:ankyrin repeat domain-containing protein n=1 Tax=Brachyspira hampsonii TaxID=1287055 RepID=UPI000D336B33|nr:ankyrin repeat domain-containing protein [Brachyspira hampsonii]PTY40063.1 ankyrin [Brachyspira hampsonii bv. II]
MKKLIIVTLFINIITLYALTENENKMINAVKTGDIRTIQTLLSQNVSPNIKDERGYSLIHIAAENNQTSSINVLKTSPYTDLNILLESNTKITNNNQYIDGSYYSAMDIAAVNKNFESVKLLIDSGANINFKMKEKPRSEFLASEYSNPQILELYLNKNIYLLMNSEDVVSLIKSASIGNNAENINYLVKNLGIDVDTKDTNTMLHYAVGNGSIEAASELIKLGANIDNTNANFKTSLHYVIENNSNKLLESVNLLLSKNANPNIKDKNGNTALHLAVMNAHKSKSKYMEVINTLIKYNADINILNDKNQLALNMAVINNDTEISNILINAESELNNIYNGYAPIHIAVKNNNISIVDNLLLNGADAEIKDSRGYTPLAIAVENNNLEICRKLIRNNAAADSKAIDLAKKINNKEIKKLLGLEEVN